MVVVDATCLEEVILQGFQGDDLASVPRDFETAVLVAFVVADLFGGAVLELSIGGDLIKTPCREAPRRPRSPTACSAAS